MRFLYRYRVIREDISGSFREDTEEEQSQTARAARTALLSFTVMCCQRDKRKQGQVKSRSRPTAQEQLLRFICPGDKGSTRKSPSCHAQSNMSIPL